MGWLILVGLALVTAAALIRFGRLGGCGLTMLAAVLLAGVAGYAWQGSPGEPGSPTAGREAGMQPDSVFALERGRMMQRFSSAAQWLDYADALHRMGSDRLAVTAIRSGLRERPNDPDLWVGLGNALVLHGGGVISPAARLAFTRAAALAPGHPGPAYFLGLAYAQAGDLERAGETWRALLARAPPGAPWRGQVEQRLVDLTLLERLSGR